MDKYEYSWMDWINKSNNKNKFRRDYCTCKPSKEKKLI